MTLEELYENELDPACRAMAEAWRRERHWGVVWLTVALGFTAATAGLVLWRPEAAKGWSGLLPLALTVIAWSTAISFFRNGREEMRRRFKLEVIGPLVKLLEPELNYFPDWALSEELFRASGLMAQPYDRYRGEDLITGRCHGVEFHLGEVEALMVKRQLSRGRVHEIEAPMFRGVVIAADFHKHFYCETVVVTGGTKGVLATIFDGALRNCRCVAHGEVVTMENPSFERHFTVYSEDPVEARYLISPVLQEEMVFLAGQFDGAMTFAFRRDRLFIGLATEYDFFELDPRGEAGFDAVCRVYHELRSFLRIVEELRLNVRIWSKE